MSNPIPPTYLPSDASIQAEAFTLIKSLAASGTSVQHHSCNQENSKRPRKPHKGNHITPSTLRLHVLASERLLRWISPHSIAFRNSLSSTYFGMDPARSFEVMSLSLDAATRSGYGSGLLCFTQFCDNHQIPELSRMPASETLLVFIRSRCSQTDFQIYAQHLAGWDSLLAHHQWCHLVQRREIGPDQERCSQTRSNHL